MVLRHLAVPIHPLRDLRALREVRTALKGLRPELITAHSSKAGFLGRLAGRSLGVPVVFTVHGWAFTPGVPSWQAAVYRQAERVVGPLAEEDHRGFGVRPAARAGCTDRGRGPAGDGSQRHARCAADLRAEPGRTPVRLVMVARFGAQKDHPTLFRALASLQHHDWELDLIGDGPLMSEVESLAAAWASPVGCASSVSGGRGSDPGERANQSAGDQLGRLSSQHSRVHASRVAGRGVLRGRSRASRCGTRRTATSCRAAMWSSFETGSSAC